MDELLKEVLSFVEGDARWWDEAAQHVEELASGLPESDQAKWQLLVCRLSRTSASPYSTSRERAECDLAADSNGDQRADTVYNVDRIGFRDDKIKRGIWSDGVSH